MKAYHLVDDLLIQSAAQRVGQWRLLFLLVLSSSWSFVVSGQGTVVANVEAINTPQSEYAPVYFGDDLVYVHQPVNGRYDAISKENYFELFRAPRADERRKKGKRFTIEPNATYHEGPISFSQDGRQVFFTKTNAKAGVSQASSSGEAKLKIYYAFQGPYGWTGVQELPINDDERNTLHPSLSPDGNRLFFASDRIEDGFGGLDLYVSEWVNGQWTPPINLGPEVNTSADECYPFIHDSGQLFFASDREGGMGAMDLYTMDIGGRQWGKVYRLPPPYNSKADDFGFILAPDAKTGYLSSNRVGSKGEDDIYAFTAPAGIESFVGNSIRQEVVSVYDAATSGKVPNARIFLYELPDAEGLDSKIQLQKVEENTFRFSTTSAAPASSKLRQFYTGEDGMTEIPLREGKSYRLLIQKAGYRPQSIYFQYGPEGSSRPLEVVLQSGECTVVTGVVVAENNGNAIAGVEVTFYPTDCQSSPVSAITQSDGSYLLCMPGTCNYQIVLRHPEYLEMASAFNAAAKLKSFHEFNLSMTPRGIVSVDPLTTLSAQSTILLKHLEYTDDRFELSSNYQEELQLLSRLLLSAPSMTILLENHTETNGPEVYYQEMSEKRVAEIKSYLVNSGVAKERIKTVAHGSQIPLRDCGRPGSCNQQEHLSNRRTAVKILSR